MPESIKHYITINGKTLPYHEVRGMYRLRYHRDGFNIDVASKSLKKVRQKFLEKLSEQEKAMQSKTPLIKEFAVEWFKFIKPLVIESTYNYYASIWMKHIIPAFGHIHLDELTRNDIQNHIQTF